MDSLDDTGRAVIEGNFHVLLSARIHPLQTHKGSAQKDTTAMELDEGVAGLLSNTTLILLVARHANIPLLTPTITPTVFDNVEVLAPLRAISHSQHSVVERLWVTAELIKDTALVVLQGTISVNGH